MPVKGNTPPAPRSTWIRTTPPCIAGWRRSGSPRIESAEALAAIEMARRLRPHQPQSFVVEGDVRRTMGEQAATARCRRGGTVAGGDAERIDAERRLVGRSPRWVATRTRCRRDADSWRWRPTTRSRKNCWMP